MLKSIANTVFPGTGEVFSAFYELFSEDRETSYKSEWKPINPKLCDELTSDELEFITSQYDKILIWRSRFKKNNFFTSGREKAREQILLKTRPRGVWFFKDWKSEYRVELRFMDLKKFKEVDLWFMVYIYQGNILVGNNVYIIDPEKYKEIMLWREKKKEQISK